MADLSAFATKDNAEEGIIFPVKINGIKFPIAIKIFGSDSDAVKLYERKAIKKLKIGKDNSDGVDGDELVDLLDSNEGVLVRIGGIWSYDWEEGSIVEDDPVTLGDKTIGNDKKSYEFLLEKVPALKDWIIEKSNKRENFLSERKEN